jgi:hypothetical protein
MKDGAAQALYRCSIASELIVFYILLAPLAELALSSLPTFNPNCRRASKLKDQKVQS